jgi:iron complex transport system ATP-binding protein
MKKIAVQASSISANLGNIQVLQGVDVTFVQGCWTSIVGPNGAGKSTLLKVLAGLLPHTGSVMLLGQPLRSLPGRVRAQQLSWLGQSESSGDDLCVFDLVMLGRLPHQTWLAAPNAADLAAVEHALKATQAWEWRHRSLGHLSGGERQRALLARALAVQAQVLLMDEPLANLDPPHQADWLDVVRSLVSQGKTVVSVLHELTMALQAQHMVVMSQGRVTHQGDCTDAATHLAVEQVFDHRISVHALDGHWVALPQAVINPKPIIVPPLIAGLQQPGRL